MQRPTHPNSDGDAALHPRYATLPAAYVDMKLDMSYRQLRNLDLVHAHDTGLLHGPPQIQQQPGNSSSCNSDDLHRMRPPNALAAFGSGLPPRLGWLRRLLATRERYCLSVAAVTCLLQQNQHLLDTLLKLRLF